MTDPLLTSHPTVRAAEAECDRIYREYQRVAGALSDLVVRNGRVDPDHSHPDFAEFSRLRDEKEKLHQARQRANDRYTALVTGIEFR